MESNVIKFPGRKQGLKKLTKKERAAMPVADILQFPEVMTLTRKIRMMPSKF